MHNLTVTVIIQKTSSKLLKQCLTVTVIITDKFVIFYIKILKPYKPPNKHVKVLGHYKSPNTHTSKLWNYNELTWLDCVVWIVSWCWVPLLTWIDCVAWIVHPFINTIWNWWWIHVFWESTYKVLVSEIVMSNKKRINIKKCWKQQTV